MEPELAFMKLQRPRRLLGLFSIFSLFLLLQAANAEDQLSHFRQQVEADWLLQEKYRTNQIRTGLTVPAHADAMGGCDGRKTGGWGFHTARTQDPWWQVDLENVETLQRVLIWNRTDNDNAPKEATNLVVRLSTDGEEWRTVYTHDGSVFGGKRDNKPLMVALEDQQARFVRIQLEGERALHLDEIEVFGVAAPDQNLALGRPADQASVSKWSFDHRPPPEPDWGLRVSEILAHCQRLIGELSPDDRPEEAAARLEELLAMSETAPGQGEYLAARWLQRQLSLANPLLDFESILVTKRVPGSYSHMSDQYYGWWSRPGGGLYLMSGFREDQPRLRPLTESFTEPGSFLRPALSYDGQKILFAWCRHYPHVASERDKVNKANLPEDAFYHVYEMNIDGTGVRRLTNGKYDNFDARYLPDGRIVFLSTRRGQSLQAGRESARRSVEIWDLPDSYVRCGGDAWRPVAVYTLHTMKADGSDIIAISPFEMFEWEPAVAHDGSILHARWDYIDRDNMPFMSLWAINPDGANPRLVYKNYTANPHCVFEPQPVPGSHKILFTAVGHHSHTMGSLALLDPSVGTEGHDPITRLTPEVAFPESEGWPITYYASPWPLSERFHLVSWGDEGAATHADRWHREGGRWEGSSRPENGMGVYFFDSAGNLELLYRDTAISTVSPIPLRPTPRPPVLPKSIDWDGPQEGSFLVQDVYHGVSPDEREPVKALRIVAVPPKTQPWMNRPELGITRDDPGKTVLGTVPVEEDGSAHFRAPAGVILFLQTLDEQGRALRTMRSATHLQPGQTVSCIGCHANRAFTPPVRTPLASLREASKIRVGPEGSWPLRFDRLVQPLLDRRCVECHNPQGEHAQAAALDLTHEKSYQSLTRYGKPSLHDQVMKGYREGVSRYGEGIARNSALLKFLGKPEGHSGLVLDPASLEQLITWMDTYAQRAGSFSPEQERELENLRQQWSGLLEERKPEPQVAAERTGIHGQMLP
jgi:hypothetical protein